MIEVRWQPRVEPLSIEGAFAGGSAARRLAQRLLAGAEWSNIRGVATHTGIVLLGNDLPWVDGIIYLGRDTTAPQIYLPTTQTVNVPPALLARAISRPSGSTSGPPSAPQPPWAVVDHFIISLAAAAPLARSRIEAWLLAA
jgi:hypothetical protein